MPDFFRESMDWFSRENRNRKPSIFSLNMGFSGFNFPLNQSIERKIMFFLGVGDRQTPAEDNGHTPSRRAWMR
jgi:hypothetical protein